MNSFAGWLLSSRFALKLDSAKQTLKEKNISIHLIMENEIDKSLYSFSLNLFGELKSKMLYPLDQTGKKYLFIFPKAEPKKLSFETPGKAHIASTMGAIFSSQLLSTLSMNSYLADSENIYISLSQNIVNIIKEEESEFLIGILQKSVTNKIKKIDIKNQSLLKNLVFSEETFSKNSLKKCESISNAMCYTRSLINMPANELNPESYEILLRSIVQNECKKREAPDIIQIDVLDYEKLKQEGCNLICAVGEGSQYKPRIVKLTYSASNLDKKISHIALVGKGITFDSGGYDLKSSSTMRTMKKDMGGSAAAVGIFFACAALNLPIHLTCYLAIAENMVSSSAMRPGDIYKTRAGFHVEIENTDAEGRLVLADALSLACEEKPDWVIDLATLTGAARVALGPMVDSLFGNNKTTNDLLYSVGIENGDWVWQMPLISDYENYFDSHVADFMNSSSAGFAGAITAGLFLQKFVSVEKWNHIDTYMWCDKPNSLWQEGSSPTGKCVRLVTRAIEKFILNKDNTTS